MSLQILSNACLTVEPCLSNHINSSKYDGSWWRWQPSSSSVSSSLSSNNSLCARYEPRLLDPWNEGNGSPSGVLTRLGEYQRCGMHSTHHSVPSLVNCWMRGSSVAASLCATTCITPVQVCAKCPQGQTPTQKKSVDVHWRRKSRDAVPTL